MLRHWLKHRALANAHTSPRANCDEPSDGTFPVLDGPGVIECMGAERLLAILKIKCAFPSEFHAQAFTDVFIALASHVQHLPVPSHGVLSHPCVLSLALHDVIRALDRHRVQSFDEAELRTRANPHGQRVTYAVVVASLLKSIERAMAGIRIEVKIGSTSWRPWSPVGPSMVALGATRYRVSTSQRTADSTLAPRLLVRFVPACLLGWLAEDAALFGALVDVLTGEAAARAKVLGRVLECVGVPEASPNSERASADGLRERCDLTASVPASARDDVLERGAAVEAAAQSAETQPRACTLPEPVASFFAWLDAGIRREMLGINTRGASVHVVAEGLLLLSPRIFETYVESELGARQHAAPCSESAHVLVRRLQRELFALNRHLRTADGRDIVGYEVVRNSRAIGRIWGVVITAPSEVITTPLAVINPQLVRAADSA